MRIIDKNTDFYDYLQNMYYDPSITFDRTDSFVVTKEMMCSALFQSDDFRCNKDKIKFILLQVCNTFWLFIATITSINEWGTPTAYTAELVHTWKNYDSKRRLISLEIIELGFDAYKFFGEFHERRMQLSKEKIINKTQVLNDMINRGDYRTKGKIDRHTVYYGNNTSVEKHIPLLKASGLASYIDPLEIYLAFEEYFSLEKQSTERTASVGITDKEKVENHGFDTKKSFRGKQ